MGILMSCDTHHQPVQDIYTKNIPAKFQKDLKNISRVMAHMDVQTGGRADGRRKNVTLDY